MSIGMLDMYLFFWLATNSGSVKLVSQGSLPHIHWSILYARISKSPRRPLAKIEENLLFVINLKTVETNTSDVGVTTSEFYGSIVCFSQIWFVFLVNAIDSVTAGETEIDEPNLFLASFAESQQQVGTFDVGVDVLFFVNVFEHVDDSQRQVENCIERETTLAGLKEFLYVYSEPLHDHETAFLAFVFVGSRSNKARHAEELEFL